MIKNILKYISWFIFGLFVLIDVDIFLDKGNISIFNYLGIGKYLSELMMFFFVLGIPIMITYAILLFFKFSISEKTIFGLIILNAIFIMWFVLVVIQKNIV